MRNCQPVFHSSDVISVKSQQGRCVRSSSRVPFVISRVRSFSEYFLQVMLMAMEVFRWDLCYSEKVTEIVAQIEMILMRILYREKHGGPRWASCPGSFSLFSLPLPSCFSPFLFPGDDFLSATLRFPLNQTGAPSTVLPPPSPRNPISYSHFHLYPYLRSPWRAHPAACPHLSTAGRPRPRAWRSTHDLC